jgi:sulfite exporter TauE/SafE/plastocyanin domain-containing protein/copper chaperone CopZ
MSIKKEKLKVYNMTCTSCEVRVENTIKKIVGVKNALASFSSQQVIIEYNSNLCNIEDIKLAIKNSGYSTDNPGSFKIVGILIIAAAIILLGTSTAGFDMTSRLNGATYFMLFVVGALTSIHCIGMCGGIMLSQSMVKNKCNKFEAIKPALLYNAGRIVSYTVLGGLVGALGSVLSLSISIKSGLQIFAGIFMIIMGLNMSGFSVFRKLNIKLPWSSCSLKRKPRTPFFIGILNGLMPCGPLQTMQLYALGTGSLSKGALSMFLFSLGTIPLMLCFGAVSGILSKGYTKTILKFSGIIVVVLGIIMGTRGLSLAGINVPNLSFNNTTEVLGGVNNASSKSNNSYKPVIENGVQVIKMNADNSGYTPNILYVQKNMPVKWIINGKELTSCNNGLVVPSLDIQQSLKSGDNIIEFTPKDKDISFSCWMGMIRGVIKVVDNIEKVDTSKASTELPPSSSGGMHCGGATDQSTPQQDSIYGSDLSKISTDVLVHKATVSNNIQTTEMKGIGNDFNPIIAVLNKDMDTQLTFDLSSFNNPDGKFSIVNATTGDTIISFDGKKGIVKVKVKINSSGAYGIVKDNNALGIIEVVDNINTADSQAIREKYIATN